jgi:tetratricopeptide (TPR) repeat protein
MSYFTLPTNYSSRHLLTVIFLVIYSFSFGQNDQNENRVNSIISWAKSAHSADVESIKDSLDNAIALSKRIGNGKLQTSAIQANIKFILDKTGDYDAASEQLELIRRIADKTNDPEIRSSYHFSRGRLYMYEGADRDKGKKEFREAVKVLEDHDLTPNYSLLNNLGISEMEDNKISRAFELFDQAENSYLKKPLPGDKDFMTTLNMNRGVAYIHANNMDSSEYYFKLAVKNSESTIIKHDDFSSNLFMGVFLQETERLDEALNYLHVSLRLINIPQVDYREKVLLCEGLSELYSSRNSYQKALEYRELELAFRDTLQQKGISEKAFALEYKAEILELKHQKKIDELEANTREEKIKERIILGAVVLLLIVALIIYRLNKRRQLSQIKAENEQLEKERIKQEAELEIFRKEEKLISANIELSASKNELSVLKSRLTSHLDKSHDPEFDDLKKFVKQISSSEKKAEQLKYIDHVLNYSNNEFYKKLKEIHPNLTDDETRMATLIRLNLSSKEIEQVFNISNSSLMTKRYRFRKKIKLDKDKSLEDYLKNL